MTSRFLLSAVLLSVLFGGPASAQSRTLTVERDAGATPRVALVVGNGAYADALPLKTPRNDAEDLAAALNEVGFTVFLGVDLKAAEMDRALRDFVAALPGAEVALVFFAGHGVAAGGVNYLLPVDVDGEAEPAALRDAALSLDHVFASLDQASVPLALVVLEGARAHPFDSWGTEAGGWAPTQGPTGTIVAMGTAPGAVLGAEPEGRNGRLTAALLGHLPTPALELTRMFRLIAQDVYVGSEGQQQPYLSLGYLGDFYMVRDGEPASD